jgi:APA family basic amino acid/polyamine antiporter
VNSGPALDRRLGLGDAVAIGLGSMLGAGIFAALAPAARAAGTALLIGLLIAGIVAWCNATSSAQLAAQYPESGGTYVYGRRELGEWPGFIAGWCFVVGKTASCAAMALTVAAYVAPDGWAKPAALVAVALITLVNCLGVSRTATATKVIVAVVIAVLAVVVVAGVASGTATRPGGAGDASPYDVLQSAGILFFAFAGYARIATMGEEVRTPKRTIPRAIVIALVLALAIYLVIAVTALTTIGPEALANSTAPLADVAAAGGWEWTAPIVRAGAVLAALGALLALMAGITRTALAMARGGDLPPVLGRISERARVPRVAAVVLGVLVAALVLAVDLRSAIGFSSFGVLLYYLVANLSAFHQSQEHRRYPRYVQILGAAGCVVLAATLPWTSILGAGVAVAIGIAYRAIRRARAQRDAELPSP